MNLKIDGNENLEGEYLEQTSDERNAGILQAWLPYWVLNAFINHEQIVKEARSKNVCVSALRRVNRNEPAVIVGSGPSLDRTAPLLGNWKGAVFSCGSNALIPTRWGHQPEYVCVFDAGDSLYPKMLGWNWKGSTLLTHPSASPLILKNWIWDKYYYLMMHHGQQWFEEILPLAYGDFTRFQNEAPARLKIMVGNAGCTVNNAIQLAHFLGYDPLFLIGVDFGYPNGVERCTRWEFENGEWKDIGPDSYSDRKLHKSENGIFTTEEQIEYKSALLAVYKWDRPQLFDCSNGIITELPKIDFEEVVKNDGRGFEGQYRTVEEIVRIADDYDAKWAKLQNERNVDRPVAEVFGEIERLVDNTKSGNEEGGGTEG